MGLPSIVSFDAVQYEVDSITHEVSLQKIFSLNLMKSLDLQFTRSKVED